MKGRRTASPRAVIPPPTRKGSDAIPPRLAPRRNSLRAQKEKKEKRALGIKIEKETIVKDVKERRTALPARAAGWTARQQCRGGCVAAGRREDQGGLGAVAVGRRAADDLQRVSRPAAGKQPASAPPPISKGPPADERIKEE